MDLVVECYAASKVFPVEERYGITAQIRRSAVSVPSNIAEGRGRQGVGGFLYHLSVAYGSLMELDTQLLISQRLHYLNDDVAERLLERVGEVRRLLSGLLRALRARRRTHPIPDSR
jgi:four helix bundle protein